MLTRISHTISNKISACPARSLYNHWWLLLSVLCLSACAKQLTDNGQALKVMPDAHAGGSALSMSKTGKRLASGGWSGILKIWEMPSGKLLHQWKAHQDSINGIAFTDEDNAVLTAGLDGRVAIWRLNGRMIREWQTGDRILSIAVFKDEYLVTGHTRGELKLWRISSGQLLSTQHLDRANIAAVAFHPSGKTIAASDTGGRAAQWDLANDRLHRMTRSPTYARSLNYAPDGQAILGSGWFTIYRWDSEEGKLEKLPTDHLGIVNSTQFTPDGTLATISRQTDSSVIILDPDTGNTIERLGRHELCGGYVVVSPDGCYLATNSDDASVRIWQTGRCGTDLSPTDKLPNLH